jgi:hypothetical protein
MLLTSAHLESIQRYCAHHKPLMEESTRAGCLSCGASFAPAEVKEWIDETRSADAARVTTDGPIPDDATAKCPKCGATSVLPSAAPVALDPATLAAIQAYWFSGKR